MILGTMFPSIFIYCLDPRVIVVTRDTVFRVQSQLCHRSTWYVLWKLVWKTVSSTSTRVAIAVMVTLWGNKPCETHGSGRHSLQDVSNLCRKQLCLISVALNMFTRPGLSPTLFRASRQAHPTSWEPRNGVCSYLLNVSTFQFWVRLSSKEGKPAVPLPRVIDYMYHTFIKLR